MTFPYKNMEYFNLDDIQNQIDSLSARIYALEVNGGGGGGDSSVDVLTLTSQPANQALSAPTPSWLTDWTQAFTIVVEANHSALPPTAWAAFIAVGGNYEFTIGPDGYDNDTNIGDIHDTRIFVLGEGIVNSNNTMFHEPALNTWDFYVVTKSSNGVVELFVNGASKGSTTITKTGTPGTTSHIGTNGEYGNKWHRGSLRNFALYDGVLTASEISSMYNNGDVVTLVDGANATFTRFSTPTP